MQREGIDYTETYAPVARLPTVRLLLAVGLKLNYRLRHLDVTTAFLNGYLDEEVFMTPPDGVDVSADKCLLLKRSIYGLKQAPKKWNERFHNFIVTLRFVQSKSDYCLYVRVQNGTTTYLVLYVDDMLLCGDDSDAIDMIVSQLSNEFKMKDLGSPRQYMGLNINIDYELGVLTIDQNDYIQRILQKFDMVDCNPSATPMEPHLQLEDIDGALSNEPYRALLGSLMYLMLGSRPDIGFAIGYLSRFQDKATEVHFKYLKRVLRYIKGTADFALVYRRSDSPTLIGYADADYANCKSTRRSTSGFLFKVYGCTVIWSSRRQPLVTLSTSESEFVAAASAAQECLWLHKMFNDLQLDWELPTVIFEDNFGCRRVAKLPETKRSKHFDVRYHFLKELVEDGELTLEAIDTKNQVADGLTKALPRVTYETFVRELCLERGGLLTVVPPLDKHQQ